MISFKKWLWLLEGGGLWDGSGKERPVGGKKPSDGWSVQMTQGATPQAPKQMKKMRKK